MLKCQTGEDLINLEDCNDDFFANKPKRAKDEERNEIKEKEKVNETILNEEIDTQNLPASPPFTKVSAIKMFSTPVTLKKVATPLRPKLKSSDLLENKTAALARKDCTKSFLPRIKKRQKQ